MVITPFTKRVSHRFLAVLGLLSLTSAAPSTAAYRSSPPAAPPSSAPVHAPWAQSAWSAPRPVVPALQTAGPAPSPDSHRYVVQLADPSMAEYRGGIGKLAPTSAAATFRVHLDVRSPAALAYRAYLAGAQQRMIDGLRVAEPSTRLDWQYAYTLNGLAVKTTTAAAAWLRRQAGVRAVEVAEYFTPELDSSAPLVGAPAAWAQAGGVGEAGRGARVAIVDTGMDAGHPMFGDSGMGPPPAGYPVARLHLRGGRTLAYPEPTRFVNGKLIAARSFPSPEMTEGLTDEQALTQFTPFDGGHGLHVAGIATGRSVTAALPLIWGLTQAVSLTGIAPMAWVLNYRYDFTGGNDYARGVNLSASPELIAMLEQMVVDEVDVLNFSEGHVTFLLDHPRTHPLAQAFEAAADAGIVVAVSAGNSGGNGPTSLSGAFKYSDKVLAVGNTSSTGSVDIPLFLAGTGRPGGDGLIMAGPRGAVALTRSIDAPLFLASNGGCAVDAQARGKMAVVVRDEGGCAYDLRATMMYSSGAVALVYVYSDRDIGGVSEQPLALPAVALGRRDGPMLVKWLKTGPPDARGAILPAVIRGHSGVPDVLAASSGRGPGIDGTLKPDLSAPGTSIWSSVNNGTLDGPQRTFDAYSGTSMSSPHVAGAVALIRGAHPTWTSAQVHSALLNTAAQSVVVPNGTESRPASPAESGVGRLDLTRALKPGAFLAPTKLSFGRLPKAATRQIVVAVTADDGPRQTWRTEAVAMGGAGRVSVEPSQIQLRPHDTAYVTCTFSAEGLDAGEHWGEVLFTGSVGGLLRTMYYAIVEDPALRKDALLIDFAVGSTPDYGHVYSETLGALNLSYDVYAMNSAGARHPPLETLRRYDLVIVNTNESPAALQSAGGFYAYQDYLIQGGSLLLAGLGVQDWFTTTLAGGAPFGPSQNGGCDMCLARYFAGFQYGLTSTLRGRVETWQNMKVLLEANPAADGSFRYPLDISTGTFAPEGAAGNQATFASGGLLGPFDARFDHPYTEGVFDRVRPFARPMWQYDGRVVGAYVAGRMHPESRLRWNAMFWGFGLEGVGQGATTAARARVLGDAFNLIAHNIDPHLTIVSAAVKATRVGVNVASTADPVAISQALVDWGDGAPQLVLLGGADLRTLAFDHVYAMSGSYTVKIDLYPVAHAAPIRASGDVNATLVPYQVHLPYLQKWSKLSGQRLDFAGPLCPRW